MVVELTQPDPEKCLQSVSLSDIVFIRMRLFKNKWFARWAHAEDIADSVLLQAAVEVVGGHVEADLGGYLFKKRLAREGSGKRGSYRVLIGYKRQHAERIIFLYAFAKNANANISDKEKEALSWLPRLLFRQPMTK